MDLDGSEDETMVRRALSMNFLQVLRPETLAFLDRLRRGAEPEGLPFRVHEQEELHEKGILGDGFYLSGSMNFTFSGISLNEEAVHFIVDPAAVAENRVALFSRWGGELT